jgi:hypothetical protein
MYAGCSCYLRTMKIVWKYERDQDFVWKCLRWKYERDQDFVKKNSGQTFNWGTSNVSKPSGHCSLPLISQIISSTTIQKQEQVQRVKLAETSANLQGRNIFTILAFPKTTWTCRYLANSNSNTVPFSSTLNAKMDADRKVCTGRLDCIKRRTSWRNRRRGSVRCRPHRELSTQQLARRRHGGPSQTSTPQPAGTHSPNREDKFDYLFPTPKHDIAILWTVRAADVPVPSVSEPPRVMPFYQARQRFCPGWDLVEQLELFLTCQFPSGCQK